MKYRMTFSLESDQPIAQKLLIELENILKNSNIELRFFNAETDCWEKCKKLILEKGSSYILSVEDLQEEVLPKVEPKHRYLLVEILRDKLKALSPSSSLTIVDYYLFESKLRNKADFLQTLKDIVDPVIHNIEKINLITKPRYNRTFFSETKQLLSKLNPRLAIAHATTEDFHDRFWIADEQKGFFIGTSLNGIGNRYALTDNIRDEDTKEIVDELRRLKLIE